MWPALVNKIMKKTPDEERIEEIEEIARQLHSAYNQGLIDRLGPQVPLTPWDSVSGMTRDAWLAVGRAAIAMKK